MRNLILNLLIPINYDLALVWFSVRLLMSPILRLVYELHLAPTTFLLCLHVLILIAVYGIGNTTSLAYNVMVLLFMQYYCRGHSLVLKKRKSEEAIENSRLFFF